MARTDTTTSAGLTVALCFVAACFEGIDLQAMGIAAKPLMDELALSPAQFGTAASMSLGGLLVGAVIGGRASDSRGRKPVLIASMVALGLFSLLTARVGTYPSLLVSRFLVGLGLGGAFPTLIALVSDVAPERRKTLALSIMYAGLPMGTVIGSTLLLAFGSAFHWRWIFYIGGVGPLFLILPLWIWLPASAAARRSSVASVGHVLFGERRALPTVLLWVAFFFTLMVIYLLTNWLNQLMTGRGFSPHEATIVLLAFGIGSVAGSIGLGITLDAGRRRLSAIVTYAGVAVFLSGLALLHSLPLLLITAFGTGFCAVGAQLVNYALAPTYYHSAIRGTGVGWTVAVGRTGSFFGPLVGGALIGRGVSAANVLLIFLPCLIVAAIASTIMLFGRQPDQNLAPIAAETLT